MPVELPEAIAGYLASANAQDADACAKYFSEDAVVHDEGQDRRGSEAICEWVKEVSLKYRPTMSVTDAIREGEKVTVTARVSGDFPGSPISLRFAFTLRSGKIARLDIVS